MRSTFAVLGVSGAILLDCTRVRELVSLLLMPFIFSTSLSSKLKGRCIAYFFAFLREISDDFVILFEPCFLIFQIWNHR